MGPAPGASAHHFTCAIRASPQIPRLGSGGGTQSSLAPPFCLPCALLLITATGQFLFCRSPPGCPALLLCAAATRTKSSPVAANKPPHRPHLATRKQTRTAQGKKSTRRERRASKAAQRGPHRAQSFSIAAVLARRKNQRKMEKKNAMAWAFASDAVSKSAGARPRVPCSSRRSRRDEEGRDGGPRKARGLAERKRQESDATRNGEEQGKRREKRKKRKRRREGGVLVSDCGESCSRPTETCVR